MPEPEWLAQLPSDVAGHVRKLLPLPNFPLQLARFSIALKSLGSKNTVPARLLAEQAWRQAPEDPLVRLYTSWSFERRVPRWHFLMLNDTRRNQVYQTALVRHIRPGMTVFEAGTGSGILAMLAAKAGASHVYTCEMEPLLVEAARENIARNGLSDKITVIPKRSDEVILGEDLPVRADLFVAELVDDFLLGEGVLSITADVQKRLLKPEAILLPDRIALQGTLVGGAGWTKGFRASPAFGLDVSSLNRFAPAMVNSPAGQKPDLAEDVTALHIDLRQSEIHQPGTRTFQIRAKRDGVADGFLHWIWLRFGTGLEYSNRPPLASSWAPQIHVFSKPVPLVAGHTVDMHLQHDLESIQVWPEGEIVDASRSRLL